MKKTILLFAIAMLSISQSFAQDRLYFLNGDETEVKITEVSSSEVKYKRLDNLEGPSFSSLKSELFMIKYANGDKEMMTAEKAPAQQVEYTTNDAAQTTPVTNSEGGLSSAVIVTDKSSSTSQSNVDKWGRTESENRHLFKRKLITGAVLLGVSVGMAIPGIVLFAEGSSLGSQATTNLSDGYMAGGAVLVIGGTAMLIAGAAIMGTSAKYKKRANQLANGTASLSPSIMNIHSYSGSSINSRAGYGLTFSYKF